MLNSLTSIFYSFFICHHQNHPSSTRASFRGGETGCQRYMTEVARSEAANNGTDTLYTALFALARLFLTPDFAPWAAEVVAAEAGDFFVPCLILLEAAATVTCAPEVSTVAGESERGELSQSGSSVQWHYRSVDAVRPEYGIVAV